MQVASETFRFIKKILHESSPSDAKSTRADGEVPKLLFAGSWGAPLQKFLFSHALFLSSYLRNPLLLTTKATVLGRMNFSSSKFSQTTMRTLCSLDLAAVNLAAL